MKILTIATLVTIVFVPSLGVANTGYLSIKSDPTGVNVRVDGRDYGPTPIDLLELEAGKQAVKVTLSRYETKVLKITIQKNVILEQSVILIKSSGYRLIKGETSSIKQGKGNLTVITDFSGATREKQC